MDVCKASLTSEKGERLRAEIKAGHFQLHLGGGAQLLGPEQGWELQLLCHGTASLSSCLGSVARIWLGQLPVECSILQPQNPFPALAQLGHSETILTSQCSPVTCLGVNIIHKQFLFGFAVNNSCFSTASSITRRMISYQRSVT